MTKKHLEFIVYFALGFPFLLAGFVCALAREWFGCGIRFHGELSDYVSDFEDLGSNAEARKKILLPKD